MAYESGRPSRAAGLVGMNLSEEEMEAQGYYWDTGSRSDYDPDDEVHEAEDDDDTPRISRKGRSRLARHWPFLPSVRYVVLVAPVELKTNNPVMR